MSIHSITQKVIKYCEMGFFPICKLQYGGYQTFTPFKNNDNNFLSSYRYNDLEYAKKFVTDTFIDFRKFQSEYLPVEIIGFYHPEFKLFEVGDKVVYKNNIINRSNVMGEVLAYDYHQKKYLVSIIDKDLVYRGDMYYRHCELEPYLETTQLKPLEVTLKDIAKKFDIPVKNLKIIK